MSPLLEPPAARPHATDPAPCLNRCSINNACSSATHLPGGQIGKSRVDERERGRERGNEWMSQCLEGGQAGRRMGNNPEARVTTGRWIRYARRSQRTGEPGDEVFSFSHLLQGRAMGRKFYVIWAYLLKSSHVLSHSMMKKNAQAHRWEEQKEVNRLEEKQM